MEPDPDQEADGTYQIDAQSYEAVVSVEDNERAKPVISIAGGPKLTEGGAATFTLTVDPAPQKDLSVTVFVQDTDGDFIASENEISRTVTIDAVSDGSFRQNRLITKTFTVDTVDDEVFEPDANIRAQIEADSGDNYEVSPDTYEAFVEIEDNERGTPMVTIEAGPAVTEGEAASFTLTADPAPEQDLSVSITIGNAGTGGIFVADDDIGERTVTIPGVSEANFALRRDTSTSFTVATVDDAENEASGAVEAYINSDPDGHYEANTDPYYASVQVQDNDTPMVSVSAPSGQILEGQPVVFTLNINPVSSSAFSVNINVSAPNNDYVDVGGTGTRTVTIPANAATAIVQVNTVDDSVVEAAEGTVKVTVQYGGIYQPAIAPGNAATASIIDNDEPTDEESANSDSAEATDSLNPYADLIAEVRGYAIETQEGLAHVERWMRVLAAFGDNNGQNPMTAAEAQTYANRGWSRWEPIAAALTEIEAAQTDDQTPEPEPEPEPEPVACVSPELQSEVLNYSKETAQGEVHVERWLRVLQTFSGTANDSTIMLPSEAQSYADRGWERWVPIATALKCLEQQALNSG